MSARLSLALALCVALPALAQDTPPPGAFRIKLSPTAPAPKAEIPTTDETRPGTAPAPSGPPAPTGPPEPTEPPEPTGPPEPAAMVEPNPSPPPATRRRPPRRRRARLKGTGSSGRETAWGVVETMTPLKAAQRRGAAGGREVEFPRKVHFKYDAIRFARGAKRALQEIADTLQATPELRLLLIEGHTDRTGSPRYNQRLSEARASAVREALVKHGVAPERLVAYGFGESRPTSRALKTNRRVVFRMVEADHEALEQRAATDWGQAAVVGSWGASVWAPGPETPNDDPLPWADLPIKTQLGEGVEIKTGPSARLLLRLPDLTRILVAPSTHLRLSKLYFDQSKSKAYTSIRLRSGQVRVRANPLVNPASKTLVAFPSGSFEATDAHVELTSDLAGVGHLTVLSGALSVSTGTPDSLALSGGEYLPLGGDAPSAHALLAAARIIGPYETPEGGFDRSPELSWAAVEGAKGYVVEIAPSLDFYHNLLTIEADEPNVRPPTIATQAPLYWRVRALDAGGVMGRPSVIHMFEISAPEVDHQPIPAPEDDAAEPGPDAPDDAPDDAGVDLPDARRAVAVEPTTVEPATVEPATVAAPPDLYFEPTPEIVDDELSDEQREALED